MHVFCFHEVYSLYHTSHPGTPSAPRFDLTSPPVLNGTDISLIWLPSNDTGGDPDNLDYDVYAAQLDGNDPIFCRQNDDGVNSGELIAWSHEHGPV